jgi:hypothetical protein
MSWKGRLEFRDLGPGQWVLRTRKGDVALFGDIDAALDGREVIVEGDAVDGFSNTMAASSAVTVRSVRAG